MLARFLFLRKRFANPRHKTMDLSFVTGESKIFQFARNLPKKSYSHSHSYSNKFNSKCQKNIKRNNFERLSRQYFALVSRKKETQTILSDNSKLSKRNNFQTISKSPKYKISQNDNDCSISEKMNSNFSDLNENFTAKKIKNIFQDFNIIGYNFGKHCFSHEGLCKYSDIHIFQNKIINEMNNSLYYKCYKQIQNNSSEFYRNAFKKIGKFAIDNNQIKENTQNRKKHDYHKISSVYRNLSNERTFLKTSYYDSKSHYH